LFNSSTNCCSFSDGVALDAIVCAGIIVDALDGGGDVSGGIVVVGAFGDATIGDAFGGGIVAVGIVDIIGGGGGIVVVGAFGDATIGDATLDGAFGGGIVAVGIVDIIGGIVVVVDGIGDATLDGAFGGAIGDGFRGAKRMARNDWSVVVVAGGVDVFVDVIVVVDVFRGAKLARNNCSVVCVVVSVGVVVSVDVAGGGGGGGVFCGGFRGPKLARNDCNCSGVNVPPDWARSRLWEPLRLLCVLILELHSLLYRLHVLNCCRRRFFVLSCLCSRIKMTIYAFTQY
jgi:hypothetical protein